MIRFWGKETREARIFRAEGFGYACLSLCPSLWDGIRCHLRFPPPDSAASGIRDMEQELHLGTSVLFWWVGVRSYRCCRTLLLSWAALQRPKCQTEPREAPEYEDVLCEHDFRAMNFSEAQNCAGKLPCDSALHSHVWMQKYIKVKKNSKKTKPVFFKRRGKKSIFWFWFKVLVSCCLTKLGHTSVQSSGYLWGSFF